MPDIGDISLIPFPYSDLSTSKKRPILILSNPDKFGDIICMAVTSNDKHQQSIAITQENFKQGTLPKASWIRTDKIFTLSEKLIIKKAGRVKENIVKQSIEQLCEYIKQ